ncbi:hypothetical protein M758_UG332700 [Ceratodon purpureus]|nr:hypothetical protein M758_UG332700 [Ceratodon purpureus]
MEGQRHVMEFGHTVLCRLTLCESEEGDFGMEEHMKALSSQSSGGRRLRGGGNCARLWQNAIRGVV